MTELEMDKVRAEIQKLFDDAARSRAEAQKIFAETQKIGVETRWYPYFGLFAAGAAFMGALVAVLKIFF
jgi:uncharacterized membrane protein YjjP (DUF1212 family)